jgi:hypothetical protein
LVTHGEKDCAQWLRNHASLGKKDQGYGAWMKAASDRPNRKVEIHVEGCATHFGREPKQSPEEGQQKSAPSEVPSSKWKDASLESLAPNPGSAEPLTTTDFEDQLREIDKELGLSNENFGSPNITALMSTPRDTLVGPSNPHGPCTQQNPSDKGPLNDVTNIIKASVGSWKKKTRARGMETGEALLVLAEKRSSDSIQATYEDYGRPRKYQRTTPMEIVLAEADHAQLRQNQ